EITRQWLFFFFWTWDWCSRAGSAPECDGSGRAFPGWTRRLQSRQKVSGSCSRPGERLQWTTAGRRRLERRRGGWPCCRGDRTISRPDSANWSWWVRSEERTGDDVSATPLLLVFVRAVVVDDQMHWNLARK